MRLRQIQALLETHQPRIIVGTVAANQGLPAGKPGYLFQRMNAYRASLNALSGVPLIGNIAGQILGNPVMAHAGDMFTVAAENEGLTCFRAMESLEAYVGLALTMANALVAEQDRDTDSTLAIQLPEGTSFDSLGPTVDTLREFFAALVGLPVGDGDDRIGLIEFVGLDVGTNWLVVKAGGTAVLTFIGRIYKAATEMFTFRAQQQHNIALMQLLQEDSKDLQKHLKTLRRAQRRQLAGALTKECAPKATPEEINKVALMIGRCEQVLERRVAFAASLKAPNPAQSLFQLPKDFSQIVAQLTAAEDAKLLGAGDKDDDK